MRLGEIANEGAAEYGKPLDGVRILAAEQMQSLPWATQLLARLGAEVVKVEHPVHGESGRGATPFMTDPDGRKVGATYLRNNLGKKSVGIDLKHEGGRELFLRLVPHFDVVAENFKAGALARMGLGYDDVAKVHPPVIYVSVSGFGNTAPTPYFDWPAYAGVAEAMSGIYEYSRLPGQLPLINPSGPLGDVGTASMATIGILAALRHRDRTGQGQYIDVAMYDSMIAFTDIVTHFWSLGQRPPTGPEKDAAPRRRPQLILDAFQASDGWFMLQVGREHQFERLAKIVGHPEWLDDPRFETRQGWVDYLDSDIRPAIESWAQSLTKHEACRELAAAGVAAGPCNNAGDVVDDPHVAARNMLVEVPRSDGGDPYLVPGNPIKMSRVADGPETRVPWVGEHTEEVLRAELGLAEDELNRLRADGVIT